MTREEVYAVIDGERAYQDKLWGGVPHDSFKSVGDFIVYMNEYMRRVNEKYTTEAGQDAALDTMRKVVALGIACFEYNGVPTRA